MKKFRFRLEALLTLRQQCEDEQRRVVAGLLSRINDQQQQTLQMASQIRQQGQKLKTMLATDKVDLEWMRCYWSYVASVQQAIRKRIETIAGIQKDLTVARQELSEAAKQKKILAKLKEKKKQRYDAEVARAEDRQTDEIGRNIFLRSRRTA